MVLPDLRPEPSSPIPDHAETSANDLASVHLDVHEDPTSPSVATATDILGQTRTDAPIAAGDEAASSRDWPERVGLEVLGGLDAEAPADALAGEDAALCEAPLHRLDEWWESPAARRAIHRAAARRLGRHVLRDIRINPLPATAEPRTLEWVGLAEQEDVSAWVASDPEARRSLQALLHWLDGGSPSFGHAIAEVFGAHELFRGLLHDLEERDWSIVSKRLAGETLEDVSLAVDVSRERVRQLLDKIDQRITSRLFSARAMGHPAALALDVHLRRMAVEVTEAASRAEGRLLDRDRPDWIRKALPPDEALVLGAVTRGPFREYLSEVGQPLADGRTTLALSDADLERVRSTLQHVAGERQMAPLSQLASEVGLPESEVRLLADLGGMERDGDAVLVPGVRVADMRRARAAEILRNAGRAMHSAEILLAGLGHLRPPGWNSANLVRSMSDEPDRFSNDGLGLWCLAGETPTGLADLRGECPSPTWAIPADELRQRIRQAATDCPAACHAPMLGGLDPALPQFPQQVAARVADRLADILPPGQRSVREKLGHPDDLTLLQHWLMAEREGAEAPGDRLEGLLVDEAAFGLTFLSAAVAALQAPRRQRSDGWVAVRTACCPSMRRALFSGFALQRRITSALVHAAGRYGLRHAFDVRSDAWLTLLELQAGLTRGSLHGVPAWLDGSLAAPDAVGLLTTPGRNQSESFALLWHSLAAYRRNELGEEDVAALAETSPWWPGWSLAEAFSILRSEPDASSRPVVGDRTRRSVEEGDEASEGDVAVDGGFEELSVSLDLGSGSFVVVLPERLDVKAGPVVVSGDGFRAGGTVDEDGRVTWHGEPRIRLLLRGAPNRPARLEVSGDVVGEPQIQLWRPADFIAFFDLGSGGATAQDPYTALPSASGPHALVLHPSLTPAVPADEERELDQGYLLHVYRQGFPEGMSVSCDGELLWEPRRRTESQIVLDVAPVALSGDAGDLKWGEACELRAFGVPDGFVPVRAVIGSQRLEAVADQAPWRFGGFVVLPGTDPLRRRGRIEGSYRGQRASAPAVVMLRRPAQGAVLRDGRSSRPLDRGEVIDRTRDRDCRLWVFRPKDDSVAEHVVFEGVRPAARYGMHGARLAGVLYALGEPLVIAPTAFNRDEENCAQVAAAVLDSGIVSGASGDMPVLRIRFRSPVGWTDRHRVVAWGSAGFHDCSVTEVASDGCEVTVRAAEDLEVAGIAVLFGNEWLGTAHLAPDPVQSAARLLATDDFCDRLALAIRARLPLLGEAASRRAMLQTIRHGPDAVRVLVRGADNPERQHLASQILARWAARQDDAQRMVQDFASALEQPRPPTALIERLATVSPCAVVRVLREGMARLPRPEQKRLLAALIVRTLPADLPEDVRAAISPVNPDRCAAGADAAMLREVCSATRLDDQFFAARDKGIGDQAWKIATAAGPPPALSGNVAIAMTQPSVRRWLATHFFSRLILQGL
ncbi:hypothetical protein DFH01_09685 [Falsiroseomonas bella]|uniref:Uncharacterized protein n=1 Tax=Falsiroseomonas bella TaxID=2184016 RepID=A0A317FGQ5_9PROT|nr:hypothetical protein [Falsiroseomonas bella]PWS37129.1 hypothetical protein DFH01_09685 [Falsiroseomonas bella]